MERDVRRVPTRSRRAEGRAVCSVRSGRRLRRVHRRQAALRRRALVPHLARDRAARRCGDGSARRDHGPRARQPQERARAVADPDEGSRRVQRLSALRAGGRRCRTRARCRIREREHPRRARGSRDRGSVRGANRRDRRCGAAPAGKAGPGYLPRGRESSRGRCERGGRVRGCTRRRCRWPGRRIRLRRRSRPGRAGGGSARARRRRRRTGPRGAARVIMHPAFAVEPWSVRETYLDLDMLAACESVFALSNGHIGLRGNVDEGEPFGLPGTYLNSFFELRPLPHAEAGYGYPASGQTIVNVTNGKIIRLLVDDEPFDVRYGKLLAHERELDLRAGVLRRRAEWRSPAGDSVRVSSTRLVSFVQRSAAAILYEVEPLDGPIRLVVQSELVANEAGGPAQEDPRAAAVLEAPLQSEHFFDRDARVVLTHSTRRSKLLIAAGMDHVVEGPDGTETVTESGPDVGRVTVATELASGERLRVIKFLAYGWSSQRSLPAVRDQVVAALTQARYSGWQGLLDDQTAYLDEFWDCADVELEGDTGLQQAVRFALFHTLQAGAPP